jgi:hypothetical protein
MKHLGSTIIDLDKRRPVVLAELHPELRVLVERVLSELGNRFTPYCGFRDEAAQTKAKHLGNSNAEWGQSPHNFKPALACDLVLDPRFVDVRPAPGDPRYPDLWDDVSKSAVQAWVDLEAAALKAGLERVTLRGGRRDMPHVQLPEWRAYVRH